MIYRKPRDDERDLYDTLAAHPLQSWAWGDFRMDTGITVERLAGFEGSEMQRQMLVTFHPIPKLPYTVGVVFKGTAPDAVQLATLKELGRRKKAIFIKLEPNVSTPPQTAEQLTDLREFLLAHGCLLGRPQFTLHSFLVDLTRSEEEMMAAMKQKTRYNVNLAQKHGVTVVEDNSEAGFAEYLRLMEVTTKRQQFYAHTKTYHTTMWNVMRKAGIAHLLKATYQGKTLTAWILFAFNGVLYYPYGASSREHREVMASSLVMWEAMKLGKRLGCRRFDLWGALGPNPNTHDSWYGFHRFKEGFGGSLAEFAGSYDLVVDPTLYKIYRVVDRWRWRWMKLKAKLPF